MQVESYEPISIGQKPLQTTTKSFILDINGVSCKVLSYTNIKYECAVIEEVMLNVILNYCTDLIIFANQKSQCTIIEMRCEQSIYSVVLEELKNSIFQISITHKAFLKRSCCAECDFKLLGRIDYFCRIGKTSAHLLKCAVNSILRR